MLPLITTRGGIPLRWLDPVGSVDVFDGFDRLIDHFAGSDGFEHLPGRADVWEDADNLYLEMELPGLTADDVKMHYEDELLTVEGEKKAPEREGDCHLSERRYGKFSRSFKLSDVVDPDSITATFKDGILTVTLAKRPETKPRKIEIKAE